MTEAKDVNEAEEVEDKNRGVGVAAREGKTEGEERSGRQERPVRNYTDLLVYQLAYRLALEVTALTRGFPRAEQYELARQLRASARSVAANIVEGWAKRISPAEFKRHLVIAAGECAETKFWLELAADERLAAKKRSSSLIDDYSRLGMMIHNLWKRWRKLP